MKKKITWAIVGLIGILLVALAYTNLCHKPVGWTDQSHISRSRSTSKIVIK